MNQSYALNMIPGGVPPVVNCKQYDNTLRVIKFTLYNADSLFTPPSGATITVSGTKPDLTGFSYNCTYSGSVASVTIQTQMTALAGNIPCQLTVASGGGVIGTATFILAVAPAALADDTIISATDIPVFQELLTQVQQEAATAGGYNARITANETAISNLSSKWVVDSLSVSVPTIPASGTVWVAESVAKSGYTAVGVVGYYFNGGSGNSTITPYSVKVANNQTSFALRNSTSSAITGVTLQVDVLYIKS